MDGQFDSVEELSQDTFLHTLKYDAEGLVPAIVQDGTTGQVLMMAWMNDESLRRTLTLGETVFWSRSRQEFWHKGATSGNVQRVLDLRVDCDGDTLLVIVEPAGPACHTGAVSCFFRAVEVPVSIS
jgi:phosphoribosyl-AMP cyclohydrolase